MRKTLAVAALVVFGLVLAAGAMLYLAFGLADAPPGRVAVAGLDDSTFVSAFENGSASVQARSRADAFAGLGFLHAQEHAWSMTLWQRTARGQLSAWLGDELLPLDRLAGQLGFGRLAQASYELLPETDREVLDAYVRGVNAALREPLAGRPGEFSALETTAEPWRPWYPLAIERLFAWLAADPMATDPPRDAPEALRELYESDALLRDWLHLHGFEHGMAWTAEDGAGARLIQRHVYGASALPPFQEVDIAYAGGPSVAGATLVGTPFMPAGRSERRAWAVLLSSSAELVPAVRDTSAIPYVYERIRTLDGREHLLQVRRHAGELFFPPRDRPSAPGDGPFPPADGASRPGGRPSPSDDAPIPPGDRPSPADTAPPADTASAEASVSADTAAAEGSARADTAANGREPPVQPPQLSGWVLRWTGLEAGSDAGAWLGLASEANVPFRLYDGDGLVMDRDGSARAVGTPLFALDHAGGVAVGNSPWSRFAVQRLDSLAPSRPADVLNDHRSAWAAELAPTLADAAVAVPEQPALVMDALAYLRNWDYAYDRASIAASIFEMWTKTYLDSLGRMPDPSVPDTALGIHLVRYGVLVRAVEKLAAAYGEDPVQWRWEDVQPHRFLFPVWSADTLIAVDAGRLAATRYAPIIQPGSGHVTTLFYGPSPIDPGPDAPARWEGWVSTEHWSDFRFRSRRFPANRFFGRYLVSDRIPDSAVVPDTGPATYTTILLPDR